MGSQTPVFALPYPVGTDRVRDGDNAIQALAERVEAVLVPSLVPTGVVVPWAGNAAPSGWLLCNGALASRTGATAALFAVIGTTYGAGDGTTTFALPDLRSRLPLGSGQGTGLRNRSRGAAAGAEDATLPAHDHGTHSHYASGQDTDHSHGGQTGGMSASHAHGLAQSDAGGLGGGGTLVRKGGTGSEATGGANADHSHAFGTGGASASHGHGVDARTVPASGVGPGDANMPPYVVLQYIVKL